MDKLLNKRKEEISNKFVYGSICLSCHKSIIVGVTLYNGPTIDTFEWNHSCVSRDNQCIRFGPVTRNRAQYLIKLYMRNGLDSIKKVQIECLSNKVSGIRGLLIKDRVKYTTKIE